MENRRDFLRLSVAGAVAAVPMAARAADLVRGTIAPAGPALDPPALVGASGSANSTQGASVEPADSLSGPAALFAPLSAGSELGLGWRYARAFAPREGAITVNLVHDDGHAARVDVCLLRGPGRGPVQSGLCDFIVMDGGNGVARMDESLGRALACLAAVVRENESSREGSLEALLSLESHDDRVWKHPEAMAVAARQLAPGAPESI